MKIINVRETQKVETPHKVDIRKLYDYDNAQAMHITVCSYPKVAISKHFTVNQAQTLIDAQSLI